MTINKTLNAAISVPYAVMGRNKIINGDMRIDQRNAGASVTGNDTVFGLDRWCIESSQSSKFTIQQNAGSVTPPPGFTHYLGITSSSSYTSLATDYINIVQRIEGYTIGDLDFGKSTAKPVTLSFWVRSSLNGTFGGSLRNSGAGRSYPFTYTITTVNTWEQKVITIPGDITGTWPTNNTGSMNLYFNLGSGSNLTGAAGAWAAANYVNATGATSITATSGATWYITGVQLEAGSSASPFERRHYGQELTLCQRYYQRYAAETGLSQGYFGMVGNGYSSTLYQLMYNGIVPFRVKPAVSYSGTLNVLQGSTLSAAITPNGTVDNSVWLGSSGITSGVVSCQIQFTGTSIPTGIGALLLNSSGAWLALSAEL